MSPSPLRLRESDLAVRYAPLEKKLFDLLPVLPEGKTPRSTADLAVDLFPGAFNAKQRVINLVSSLAKKAAANNEPFRIVKSVRKGPAPIDVWVARHG